MDPDRARYFLNIEAVREMVDDILRSDASVAAIAQLHARRADFELSVCLAAMVKALAADKDRITKIASELIARHGA